MIRPAQDAWYPVAILDDLRERPLRRALLGRPLVVFRGDDGIGVLVDRCPHRSAPLSEGRLRQGGIECPYHGWRFAADGRCLEVPGAQGRIGSSAEALPVHIRDGLVWTSLAPATAAPAPLPASVTNPDYDTFWWSLAPSRAVWIEAVENLLDASHPHFLHSGIVRSGAARQRVTVTITQSEDWVEAAYDEDRRPAALVPRLMEGRRTRSVGRFYPPATGQLVFEGPQGERFALTVIFTPEAEDIVRPFAHFATPKGILPPAVKRAVLKLAHRPILAQDRSMLARQAANMARTDGAPPAIGPIDFLRLAIEDLARGERLKPGVRTYEVML